jgi:hypothetical protein
MALAERMVSVDSSWLHNPTVGNYFPFVLGIGAIFRRRIQSSKDSFLSGRSLDSRVTNLANLGAHREPGPLARVRGPGWATRTVSCGRVARR